MIQMRNNIGKVKNTGYPSRSPYSTHSLFASQPGSDPLKDCPLPLLNIIGSYLEQYQPCLWTDGQPKQVIPKNEEKTTEVQFKLNNDNTLTYAILSPDGKHIEDNIDFAILKAKSILPLEEVEEKEAGEKRLLTSQEYLNKNWPVLWNLIASRGHACYAMKEANKLAAANPSCHDALKKVLAEHLNQLVAWGRLDEAESMIQVNPALLKEEATIEDYSGRKLRGTALEMALGAEDVNLYANNGTLLGEGMVEMIHRYLRELPDGEAEITRQTLKQFPEGWEKVEEKKYEEDLKALTKVSDEIKTSSSDEECQAAIREFKEHLAPPKEAFTTGKHWHVKLLQAAFEMSSNGYFNTQRKNNLFYSAVIGSIQTLAPANVAMAQAQGLKYLLADGKKFERKLTLKYYHGVYYPLKSRNSAPLGSDSWVDFYFGRIWSINNGDTWGAGINRRPFIQSYVEAKTTLLQQFMPQPDSHRNTKSCCVMM